jgi:hypothetical protein
MALNIKDDPKTVKPELSDVEKAEQASKTQSPEVMVIMAVNQIIEYLKGMDESLAVIADSMSEDGEDPEKETPNV